jgi:hypothetical protein
MPNPSGSSGVAPGSMFPSLYGDGEPGDRDAGQDITGQVLPDLSPKSDLAPGTGESLSSVPGGVANAADAPGAGAAPNTADSAGRAPQDRRPRTAQERIAQLTRRYRQAEDQNSNLNSQLQELIQISRVQSQEIAALRSGRAAPASPAGEINADPTGGAQARSDIPITLDAVRNVVRDVISGYDTERRAQDTRVQQMRQAHEEAFKDAAQEMPELMDQRSRARQIFDELYAQSPLITLPDAPYQIALQVRGILADEQRRGQVAETRKVQVSAMAPSAPAVGDASSELVSAQREFAQLTKVRQGGNEDFKVYKRWRMLRDFLSANGVR